MTEDKQKIALAPAKYNPRSDEEFTTVKFIPHHQRKSGKYFVYFLTLIVLLCAIALVFALLVMRAKTPHFTLSLIAAQGLRYATSPNPSLNVTLVVEVSIDNINFGPFEFDKTIGRVLYEETVVGEVEVKEGRVESRETENINVQIDVRSRKSSDAKNLSSDLNSGVVKLRGYVEMNGRVLLMGVAQKRRMAILNCTMSLNLTSGLVGDLSCN